MILIFLLQFQINVPQATPFFLLVPKTRLGCIAQPLFVITCYAIGTITTILILG